MQSSMRLAARSSLLAVKPRSMVSVQQKRTLLDRPNTVLETQRALQKGSTPYLRGEADPTYLRLPRDAYVTGAILGAATLGLVWSMYGHVRMWVGAK